LEEPHVKLLNVKNYESDTIPLKLE
jgi:hypothetical protein